MSRFYAGQPDYIDELNKLAAEVEMGGGGGGGTGTGVAVTGTSTTSNTIGTGTKSFLTGLNRGWVQGQHLIALASTNVTNWMVGQIVSYNVATGELQLDVIDTNGSGTFASWNIAISGVPGADGVDGTNGTGGGTGTVNIVFRGGWVSGTNYAVNDLVEYQGSTYIRLVAGTQGTAPSGDTVNWDLFVSKGEPGADGSTANATFPNINGDTITTSNSLTMAWPSRDASLSANRSGELLRSLDWINVAEWMQTELYSGAASKAVKIQQILDAAHDLALVLEPHDSYHKECRNKYITVFFPMGSYPFSNMLYVPDFVNIHTEGFLHANRNAGTFLGDDIYRPGMVFSHMAAASKLNYRGNHSGNNGQGVVFGQAWDIRSVSMSGTGVSGGSGYGASTTFRVRLSNNEKGGQIYGQYHDATGTATTNANGNITSIALDSGTAGRGAYRTRPPKMRNWTEHSTTNLDTKNWGTSNLDVVRIGTGNGSGAVCRVTWMPMYESTHWNCGEDSMIFHATFGDIEIIAGGNAEDATKGPTFGVCLHGMNARFNDIMVQGQAICIDFWRSVDTHVQFANTVGGLDAMSFRSGGATTVSQFVIDSPVRRAICIDGYNDLTLRGHCFAITSNDAIYGAPTRDCAIAIQQRQGGMTQHLTLEVMLENLGRNGSANEIPAMRIKNTACSNITIYAWNSGQYSTADGSSASGTTIEPLHKRFNKFAHIGADVRSDVMIRGVFDNIADPFSYEGSAPVCGIEVYDGTAREMLVNQPRRTVSWASGLGT